MSPAAPHRPGGLHVVTAPRLEPLFERLADVPLAADPLPPQERETILVAQNRGLRAWVEQALARRLGCAAALDVRAPRAFATDLARVLERRQPDEETPDGERHPFDAAPLAWRLAAFLDALPEAELSEAELSEAELYAPLRAYLEKTGGATMPLARRLAQLFDDYQVYRPDVLAAWARGETGPPDFPHGAWQANLWRHLAREAGAPDRAERLLKVIEALEADDRALVRHLPKRVSVFGALLFPPLYYRVLAAAARHVPVTLYAVAPGPGPREGPFRHPLLRALGERTRDYWTVLDDLGASAPVRLAADAEHSTALRQLQAALSEDRPPPEPAPLDPADRSLCVLDCHSERRELEALRDALLDAFADLDGLRPSDVLVILPDLARYAPLVDAVFGAEDATGEKNFRLPYHVADHPHAPALRVIEAFHKALRLHDGRVTASELLDLLDYPAVRRRADVAEDELPLLRAWVREAGVCWGLGADRKAAFGLPEDDLHTWRFGLDRLLLGVATGPPVPGEAGLVLGHLPCDAAGLGGADLLGRFAAWTEALFDALRLLDRPRRLADWPAHLLLFVEGLLAPRDDEEVEAVVFLRTQAADLTHLHALAGADDAEVSFFAVRAHLETATAAFERHEPFLTGRVTFADPVTLRHAPHRVVAFVGLNDGVFPAPEAAPGFDLIAHAPRPGDAAPRKTEKQLFLDAVLAARDRLILSYVGRSQKDNSARAASVALDAFLDAAERHWGPGAPGRLVVRHRLQPFAADYFRPPGGTGRPGLFSYAAQHRVRPAGDGALRPFLDGEALAEGEAPDTVSLADLVFAWTNPSRFVIGRRLKVSLALEEATMQDDEPVQLDGLGQFKVRQAVLDGLLDGLPEAAVCERLLRGGLLPGGAPGAAWLRQAVEAIAPIAEAVRAWGTTSPRPVEVEVEGARVVGTVERVCDRGALRYRAGTVREKDLVAAWVDHLALCASDARRTCTLGTKDSSHFEPLDADDARMLLQGLVRGYHVIRRTVPPLFERASYTYAEKLNKAQRQAWTDRILQRERAAAGLGDGRHNGTPDVNDYALREARKIFDGRPGKQGERVDVYVALATRGRDPFRDDARGVHRWAACLWAPLLEHRQAGLPR